ncbi:hypothetical protein [Tenacibaculum agarivorans]|uniref:hypothetical protein n=1 Tax=Tenacibaculum agarivorans TaxID=1908389 RepID=UPI00094B7951|nr:hypothetical protein [Tenacibaculum agarivorans]
MNYYIPKHSLKNILLILVIVFFSQCNTSKKVITNSKDRSSNTTSQDLTPSFNRGTKIVRGFSSCDNILQKIEDATSPHIGPNEPLVNLSVSASNVLTYKKLAKNLPHNFYACATLGELRNKNTHISIVSDPTNEDPNHCLISNITPKQLSSVMAGQCKRKQ